MRFPEFTGEWKMKKLGEIAEKINSGKTPLGGEAVYTREGVLFIRSQNVNNDKLDLDNPVYIPESINNQMKNSIVKSDDILLNITGASLGRSCVVPKDFKVGNVNQHVCIIRLNIQYSPRFVQPIFSSNKGQLIFNSLQTGSGREGLNFESIKGIKLSIPQKDEQIKIATFLSLIDQRIETQNKIIKKLESLIRGIYSATKQESWIMYYLRDVLEQRDEQNIHEYPVFSVAVREGIINQIEHLGRSFAAKDTRNYNVVQFGDIVYTKSPTGSFPYGIVKQSFINHPVAVSPLYGVYKPKNHHLGNILHHYFLSPINANNYLHSLIQKGAKNTINITSQRFLDKAILLPVNEIEIKNISLLLEVISRKIHLEKDALIKAETQKKYLSQQMFI